MGGKNKEYVRFRQWKINVHQLFKVHNCDTYTNRINLNNVYKNTFHILSVHVINILQLMVDLAAGVAGDLVQWHVHPDHKVGQGHAITQLHNMVEANVAEVRHLLKLAQRAHAQVSKYNFHHSSNVACIYSIL